MHTFSRRDLLRFATAGFAGVSSSSWMPALAASAAEQPKRACILLWMSGGPSQIDTLDPKPEHTNGGSVQAIDTAVRGIQLSEFLPQVAKRADELAVIRSMSTKEGDHARATFHLRTGYRPTGPVQYPAIGAALSKELGSRDAELPNYVSIGPASFFSPAAFGPGFLGPQYAPMTVGGTNNGAVRANQQANSTLAVRNLELPRNILPEQADARLGLLSGLEDEFLAARGGTPVESHRTAYEKAVRMMRSEAVSAFDLGGEVDKLKDAYGRNPFGLGCLLARRLVERGVPFVEVSLSNVPGATTWDTHRNNRNSVRSLCGVLDPAWATLLRDLKERGLLESTLVVWMGEFGRTPKMNRNNGRDHFPGAWSTALAGAGIAGGSLVGKTGDDGVQVEDRPISVPDLMATICQALEVDPRLQNMSNVGRPIRLADPEAKPIDEILTT
jgi:uncharacterized protein (DUF1501 family)